MTWHCPIFPELAASRRGLLREDQALPPADYPAPSGSTSRSVAAMTSKNSFRPHERIKGPAEFRRAFDRKRSAADGVLIVYGVENGLDHPRLGISVSRKKVRNASARNRVKRLIREAFRLSKSELPKGVDIVVLPRSGDLSFASVQQSLRTLGADLNRRLKPRFATPGVEDGTKP
jgi:ribonuclease P protein component